MKKALMYASVASMIQQFNMNNIKLLQELGYNVEVGCNFEFGSTISDEKIKEFQETLDGMGIAYYQIPIPRKMHDIKSLFKSYKTTLQLMNREHYDLIHCHSPIGGIICRFANRRSNYYNYSKMIYTAHGFHFFKGNQFLKNFLFRNIERCGALFTDTLITINCEDYEAAKKFKLKKNGCVKYVPGIGVDVSHIKAMKPKRKELLEELGLEEDTKLIVSVGELNSNKNHKVVLEALAKLPQKFHYIICGQGEKEKELLKLAGENNCFERFHLLGYRKDVISIVKSSDFFVFPSKREGLSVALMEALASDVICLASDIRGNRDLICHKKNGFLFKSGEDEVQSIYSIIQAIDTKGVQFQDLDKQKILQKIDIRSIENDMRNIYSS